ncbi:MAG: diaminopimelate decarboxylase [Deltaproteobacteria bacterium]|nr:diaminopimelate decarboxylase [Deltaproteobacteria bacterium]
MNHFQYRDAILHADDIPVRDIVAKHGTPLYIYSRSTLERHFQAFSSAFDGTDHLVCYSVKANSNLGVLNVLGTLGCGADIVSGGELFRALRAGIPADRIVFSGVGKQEHEIREALYAGILMFNVESVAELERIDAVAGSMDMKANVSLRINPDVDPGTHPYVATGLKTSKFGIDMAQAIEVYLKARDLTNVEPVGIDAHIGSQLTAISPFLDALARLKGLNAELRSQGVNIRYLDLGGGLGITYNEEEPPHPAEFGRALTQSLKGLDLTLVLEPGRVIVGNAGILVTEVQYTKTTPEKTFVVVDAAMNDLIRPALYGSYHKVAEVEPKGRPARKVDVVGPICESSDFLAKDRELAEVEPGELLAVFSAGAYGFTMSSQYNSRPRAAEILVSGQWMTVIRDREQYRDLTVLEEGGLKELSKGKRG